MGGHSSANPVQSSHLELDADFPGSAGLQIPGAQGLGAGREGKKKGAEKSV